MSAAASWLTVLGECVMFVSLFDLAQTPWPFTERDINIKPFGRHNIISLICIPGIQNSWQLCL